MRRIIIGTAGHVDHGKTALTKALTGTDTDRLPEEKARGITIRPGYALWRLSEDLAADLIDVPGHHKLVRAMTAGASAIDLALLTVAADEGIMPQTREHLDILSLLGIGGVLVITKCDKNTEKERLPLKKALQDAVRHTSLADAPLVEVSVRTGAGLAELTETVRRLAAKLPPPPADAPTRLPIDRCFPIKGFGTVVTGTLWGGHLQVGQKLRLLPSGLLTRVRRLEVNGQAVDHCANRLRAALNLPDLRVEQIPRGAWLVSLEQNPEPDHTLLTEVFLLPRAAELPSGTRLRLRFGTTEVSGKIRFPGEPLRPGETRQVKLHPEKPLFPLPEDRLILAGGNPIRTLGGARVLAINPPKKSTEDTSLLPSLLEFLREYHRAHPLSPGVPAAELKQKCLPRLSAAERRRLLTAWQKAGRLRLEKDRVALADFQPCPDAAAQKQLQTILHRLEAGGMTPPARAELLADLPTATANALIQLLLFQDKIVESGGILFEARALEKAEDILLRHLRRHQTLTLAEARTLLGTSRKFALAVLNHLDCRRLTRRQGDVRVLTNAAQKPVP